MSADQRRMLGRAVVARISVVDDPALYAAGALDVFGTCRGAPGLALALELGLDWVGVDGRIDRAEFRGHGLPLEESSSVVGELLYVRGVLPDGE